MCSVGGGTRRKRALQKSINGAFVRTMIGPDTLSLLAPAVTELKAAGATSVYVFGSVASRGILSPGGDVDLAVTGVPPGRFYRALGRVMRTLPCSVDLIDLDRPTRFAQLLRERNHLVRIG